MTSLVEVIKCKLSTIPIGQPIETFLFLGQPMATFLLFGQPIAAFLVEKLATAVKLTFTRHFDIDE